MRRGELRTKPKTPVVQEAEVSDSKLILMLIDCGMFAEQLLSVDPIEIKRPPEPFYAFGNPVALNFT